MFNAARSEILNKGPATKILREGDLVMRLNKKQLAALAMSAVMAASTLPFPVLAEEFTDMAGSLLYIFIRKRILRINIQGERLDGAPM